MSTTTPTKAGKADRGGPGQSTHPRFDVEEGYSSVRFLSIALVATLVCFLFGPRCRVAPERLFVGVAEVGAITCLLVSVPGAQFAVTRG